MTLKVLPATEADLPRNAIIEAQAYAGSRLSPYLFPGPHTGDSSAGIQRLAEPLRNDPACRCAKVIDTDLPEDEQMIAFSYWYFWEAPPKHDSPSSDRGPGSNPEACEAFFGGMDRIRLEMMGDKAYTYLKLLHTDPKHQKRGAGAMLVKWGLEEADRLSLPAYLESSPAGRALYEKHGFQEVTTLDLDFSKWNGPSDISVPIMLRPVGGQ